ncbi:attractin-like protein 1 isoform X2 [Harmonia axyridis]|uniref:attractin-like protein 1 isoform X2 n=1 Tax=Harmonia axyridis TaxID=115357 RepID=UPI001E2792E2|nr:attractin-like protein 1 isoform X2 [Harmonia axyridis]
MLEVLQMFLFLFKSKYRRKSFQWTFMCCAILVILEIADLVHAKCQDTNCNGNGVCRNDTCVCYDGWQGPQCQFCGGKVRLGASTGLIYDGLGNYSINVKCSWLIDAPNSSITLHLDEFATECGWDHLYIFDGDSVASPLLGVFSGLMYKDGYSIRRIPEVVASSGSALVHFFSDDAFNMSGFNISYRLNACPSNVAGVDCSGNGACIDGQCTCDGYYGGVACHLEKCPNNCGKSKGRGRCDQNGCICNSDYKGYDCSQLKVNGYWETISVPSFVPPGSASHGAVVWKDSMYVTTGESYGRGTMLYVYDFNGNVWEKPQIATNPSPRYGHSTVIYGDKIFLYGGILGNRGVTSEIWAFDISAKTWENITVKSLSCNDSYFMCGPLKLAGHTATVVTNIDNKKADRMIVIFGYSSSYGYLNTVQEYYFGEREWYIVNTRGFPVKGGYGHSAAWDSLTSKIYVYGGIVSESDTAQTLSRHLYSYEPNSRTWTLLTDSPSSRFLHSASFITPGMMLVFGGNTHNDTAHSFGAKCYSAELLAYDVTCDSWHALDVPKDIQGDLPRFGHSAVVFESSLYIYGGFDGQMLSDMIKYTPGDCSNFHPSDACLNAKIGVKCVWDIATSRCVDIETKMSEVEFLGESERCPVVNRSLMTQRIFHNTERCNRFEDCSSCTQTTSDCIWCGNTCSYKECRNTSNTKALTAARSIEDCPSENDLQCHRLHTCSACNTRPECRFTTKCVPKPSNSSADIFIPNGQCKVCSEFNSCLNCTIAECIWCQNEGRCVDKNAYTASFPYGQCREWTTVQTKCRSKGSNEKSQCSFYSSCTQCRDDPACGWCDDGSKTGLGKCMLGGFGGPILHMESLPSTTCLPDQWHFTTCPKCQCNGHAVCVGNTSVCEPCGNLTSGDHCEHCMKGYWGNPINGGKCMPCECNNHATHCHPDTGKCYCTIKGLNGEHCDNCDNTNHYYKDEYNNGSCFYDLTVDYQFTFNLSKKEERHYTQINFRNTPSKPDIDADFSIQCSVLAKMNITVRKGTSKEETPIFTNHNCTTVHYRFSKSEYTFGTENNTHTTFYVYVYDFQPPLWIQISFSQYPKLNLQQFFITFSSLLASKAGRIT